MTWRRCGVRDGRRGSGGFYADDGSAPDTIGYRPPMLHGYAAGLTATYGITLHGLMVVLSLLAYVVASHAFNQRRHPTAAIAWVFFILLVPYVALPAFLVFGSRKQPRPSMTHRAIPLHSLESEPDWRRMGGAGAGTPARTEIVGPGSRAKSS